MGINYEKSHEVEEILNFIRVANNASSVRYASQVISFILSKYQIELEIIAKIIVDIFKESSGIKKDYLSILFNETKVLEIQNIDTNEITKHSIELLDKFKSSPNISDMKHIDLYYRNNYITQIYAGIDFIQKNKGINKISIDKMLLDESFNEFKKMCFSQNISFLDEITILCIIESYEKEICVRNLGNIIKNLVLDGDVQKVLQRDDERKIDIKKDEKKIKIPKEQYNEQVIVNLNSKEFLCKYKDIINLDDDRVKDIFDYKYIPKWKDENFKKNFTKELNCIFEKYLDDGNLTEKEKEIFKLKCNLDLKKEYTLKEIGEKYNLTRERIRQIILKCHNKIVRHMKRSKEGQRGREFYFILFKLYKEFNSEYEKKLIITLQNEYVLNLYCSILELDLNVNINDKMKHLLNLYNKNKSEYEKDILLEQKEVNRQKKLIERILKDVIWFDKVNILTEDIYRKIVQLRFIEEDKNNPNKGSYYSYKMCKEIQYESSIEKDYLLLLEDSVEVKYYSVQPFKIDYFYEGRLHSYYPDIFFVLNDGRAIIVEIKAIIEMPLERNLLKYNALKDFCNKNGFGVLYTDSRNSFEKYASKSINNEFEEDIINELKKGPMDWRKCEDIILEHKVDKQEITIVIIRNNIKYTQNPFCIKL